MQGKRSFHSMLSGVLALSLLLFSCLARAGRAEASYVNTNMNTFIHDPVDAQNGVPGQEMELHVRIGYNGSNGLYNPPTDEIQNVRVRLSNDQNYLSVNEPNQVKKENPYRNSSGEADDSEAEDAWEKGYKAGKNNAYKNKLNYVYPVDGGVYPFEINASLFTQEKRLGSMKKGQYADLSFKVRVRSDALKMKDNAGKTSDGYFGIPFTIWYDIPGVSGTQNKTEFINVYVGEAGEVKNPATSNKDKAFTIGEQQSTPVGTRPEVMNYSVNFRNQSGKTLYDVTVKLSPALAENESVQLTQNPKSEAVKDFPFDINEANYDQKFDKVEDNETISPGYSMAIKQNAASGFYPLHYIISYKLAPGADVNATEDDTFFVNVQNPAMVQPPEKKDEDKTRDFNANDRTKARIVVDSYHTEPETVYAGQPFVLVMNVKNASQNIGASNILLNLSSEKVSDSAVFSVEGGASSISLNDLGAGKSSEVRVQMTAAAGVDPKTYGVTVNEKYDSPDFKNAEEKVDLNIPVNQIARLSCSNFDVTPESVEIGAEADATFGINNTGKVTLYNVEAVFEAPSIKSASAYVGNIKPGETGNVDVMLSGVAATEDDGTIPVKINYENVNGEKFSEDAKITLTVVEKLETDDDMQESKAEKEGGGGSPVRPIYGIVGAAAVLSLVFAVFRILKRRRKKKDESI